MNEWLLKGTLAHEGFFSAIRYVWNNGPCQKQQQSNRWIDAHKTINSFKTCACMVVSKETKFLKRFTIDKTDLFHVNEDKMLSGGTFFKEIKSYLH